MKFVEVIKRKKGVFIVILLAVIIWSAIWVINYLPYHFDHKNYLPIHNSHFYVIKNGYTYGVKCPDLFISLQGNYSISNEDCSLVLILWPSFCHIEPIEKNKIGARLYDKEANHGYMFYVTDKLEYIPSDYFTEEDEIKAKTLLSENREELRRMYNFAKEEWR